MSYCGSRSPDDKEPPSHALIRPAESCCGVGVAVDGRLVAHRHLPVQAHEGAEEEEQQHVHSKHHAKHHGVRHTAHPPPVAVEGPVEEVWQLRRNREEDVGEEEAGVEQEEEEELAVVVPHRVRHPRAVVVHVERQPPRHAAKVRARRLVQARPAADLELARARPRLCERRHPALPLRRRHARVRAASVRPRADDEPEQRVEYDDERDGQREVPPPLERPEDVGDVVESDDHHDDERKRRGLAAWGGARCAGARRRRGTPGGR
mmetsp:Transcript_18433/g.54603  ORF Transcript_18433/g.54603 Transcript_18433/m.54603 type:complete len:263 (+) Transcript_18433:300-1088(+)